MQKVAAFVLSNEQRQFFQAEGYLVLNAITTPEEVQRLRQAYDMLLALHTGHASTYRGNLAQIDASLKQTGRILLTNPQRYHQAFIGTLFESNALHIARQVVGDQVKLRGTSLLYKPAHIGSRTPWHQEDAYLSPERSYDFFTFWLALQNTSEESGCMHFIPGSHTQDSLPHYQWASSDDNTVLTVDSSLFDRTQAVACPLAAGGATMHTTRTLHYAGPNLSDKPRRGFILDIEYPRRSLAGGTIDGRE